MPSVDRLPYEDRLDDLRLIYAQAQKTIIAQIEAGLASGQLGRRTTLQHQLAAVLDTLTQLGHDTDPIARQLVASAHTESAVFTADQIGIALTPVQRASFASVSTDSVRAFEDQILGRLQDARQTIGRRVQDTFADAGRRSTLLHLLGAQASPDQASSDLVRRLADRGVRSFTDSAGRQWTLENYADMAIRTTTRQAVVEGAKIRMVAQGIRIARVSQHASSCPICAPWEGRLVALDDTAGDYHGEAVASFGAMPGGGPPFHPNCRHTILPVAEEVDRLIAELAGA